MKEEYQTVIGGWTSFSGRSWLHIYRGNSTGFYSYFDSQFREGWINAKTDEEAVKIMRRRVWSHFSKNVKTLLVYCGGGQTISRHRKR